MLNEKLEKSKEIYYKAVEQYDPYAIVLMISGGNDSRAIAEICNKLDLNYSHILHGITGTGIQETTDYVRKTYSNYRDKTYIEAKAFKDYEEYVLRKGFFGLGVTAHSYAYHLLKHGPFLASLSRNIRKYKRGRNILLINGVRKNESTNRYKNHTEYILQDGKSKNIWVNILLDYTNEDRSDLLQYSSIEENPVSKILCRSGECLCGTMQDKATRVETSFYFPNWGKWIDNLEKEVKNKFNWGWGENMPKGVKNSGQCSTISPACGNCLIK